MVQLSENLKLTFIGENNVTNNKLIAVECVFEFYGKEGLAYISTSKLEDENPSYLMIEIESNLSDSFNDLLEQYWFKIVQEVKVYFEDWKSNPNNS